MRRRVAILGSTGSIGRGALQIAAALPEEIEVVALACRSQTALLEAQIERFAPRLVAVYDEEAARALQRRRPELEVVAGMEGLCAVARSSDADTVLCAISGSIGILPTVAALEEGKRVALANKEVLVAAGAYVMELARARGAEIIPVDSEHSALFQCLQTVHSAALLTSSARISATRGASGAASAAKAIAGSPLAEAADVADGRSAASRKLAQDVSKAHSARRPIESVRRLILTASGGPFYRYQGDQFAAITAAQALAHPNYAMGAKISVDSSTWMNKGLELIEARWLFDLPASQIEVVVHPQQIIHSMVEFIDGSLLAQASEPTMLLPIQYALTYPERAPSPLPPFDFRKSFALTFDPPDVARFPCLRLAYEALEAGGSAPCFLNAANEALVARFLASEIGWLEIHAQLERLMRAHRPIPTPSLSEILEVDAEARKEAQCC